MSVANFTRGTIRWQFTFHTVAGRRSRPRGQSMGHSRGRSKGARGNNGSRRTCRPASGRSGAFRQAFEDARLIFRWSRMPNWSSNASREMAPPGRSLYASTRAESSTSAIGSPAIEPKPRIWRRTSSSGFTELWAATVQFTAALQLG